MRHPSRTTPAAAGNHDMAKGGSSSRSAAGNRTTERISRSRDSGGRLTLERAEVAADEEGDTLSFSLMTQGAASVHSPSPSSRPRRTPSPLPSHRPSARGRLVSPPRPSRPRTASASPPPPHVAAFRAPSAVVYESESASVAADEPPPRSSSGSGNADNFFDGERGEPPPDVASTAATEAAAESSGDDLEVPRAAGGEEPWAEASFAPHPDTVEADPPPPTPGLEVPGDDPPASNDEGQGREPMLNAEVSVAAAARSHAARRPLSPPPPPPASPDPAMVCGVPVAQPISAVEARGSGDYLDIGDGEDEAEANNSNLEIVPTDDDIIHEGELLTAPSSNSTHPHLHYLGHVVMATVDEGVEEGGGERARSVEGGTGPPPYNSSHSPTSTPASSDDSPSDGPAKSSSGGPKRRLLEGVLLAVVVICAAVGIALGTGSRGAGDGDSRGEKGPGMSGKAATPPPTFPPAPLSDTNNAVMRLLDPFLQSTGSNAHRIEGTPQHRAVEWLDATSWGALDHFDLSEWMDAGGGEGSTLPPEQEGRLIQRYVLAVLYYFTTGELDDENVPVGGWRDDAHFLTDAHECEWRSPATPGLGVTCDDELRVTEIVLENNRLSGLLPRDEFHGLDRLRKLDLSYNFDLRGPLPPSLGRLSELRTLLFTQNSLTGTVPLEFGNMTSLREFSLADNDLTGTVPPEVAGMASLTNIWLNQNEFTGGMNNFCRGDIPGIILFYSDCFCRTFPRLEPKVECACCTICCAGEGPRESCHPNVPCTTDDCFSCSGRLRD